MSKKNSNDTSWDRTNNLPICSTAPLPLCYRNIGSRDCNNPHQTHVKFTYTGGHTDRLHILLNDTDFHIEGIRNYFFPRQITIFFRNIVYVRWNVLTALWNTWIQLDANVSQGRIFEEFETIPANQLWIIAPIVHSSIRVSKRHSAFLIKNRDLVCHDLWHWVLMLLPCAGGRGAF